MYDPSSYQKELARAKDKSRYELMAMTDHYDLGPSRAQKRAERNTGYFLLTICLLIVVGMLSGVAWWHANNETRNRTAVSVEAVVEKVTMVMGTRSGLHFEVEYSYDVSGKSYTGINRKYLVAIKPGASLRIRYMPDNPADSFIPGYESNPTLPLLGFAALFSVFAVKTMLKMRDLADTPEEKLMNAADFATPTAAKPVNLPAPDVMPGASVMPTGDTSDGKSGHR